MKNVWWIVVVIILVGFIFFIGSGIDFAPTTKPVDVSNKAPGENPNPCNNPTDCAAMTAYAAAGDDRIDAYCDKLVLCIIDNRVRDQGEFRDIDDACKVVSQRTTGGGYQFDEYRCVNEPGTDNQKYCRACSGEDDSPHIDEDKQIWEDMQAEGGCREFDSDPLFFNNHGPKPSWMGPECVQVQPISDTCKYISGRKEGQPVFDFYRCGGI